MVQMYFTENLLKNFLENTGIVLFKNPGIVLL